MVSLRAAANSGMTAIGRKRPLILLILTTIERPLLGKADIKLILVKRSANDPKRTSFPMLTTQPCDGLVTVQRRGFYV
jgi:hypothetical protein